MKVPEDSVLFLQLFIDLKLFQNKKVEKNFKGVYS